MSGRSALAAGHQLVERFVAEFRLSERHLPDATFVAPQGAASWCTCPRIFVKAATS